MSNWTPYPGRTAARDLRITVKTEEEIASTMREYEAHVTRCRKRKCEECATYRAWLYYEEEGGLW